MTNRRNTNHFTRKEFIKVSWVLMFAPFLWIWYSLVKKQLATASTFQEVEIPSALPSGISFFDRIIAVKNVEGEMTFLSSRCTHLGCSISSSENDVLICPCHGSRFGPDGRNLSGPASEPLTKLLFRTDLKTGRFIVKLPAE